MVTRRQFIQRSGAGFAAGAVLPSFFSRAVWAAEANGSAGPYGNDTILVVVQMQGGNDGLNTVVPYGVDGYHEARPAIGFKDSEVLPLTDRIGLHPSMTALRDLYQAGQVAIIQGVGYPNQSQNLSHFRATDIWLSAAPDRYENNGWLGDYLAAEGAGQTNPLYAASVTDTLSHAFTSSGVTVPAIGSVGTYQFRTDARYPNDRQSKLGFVQWAASQDYSASPLEEWIARTTSAAITTSENVQAIVKNYQTDVNYPRFSLGNSLKTVAQLMSGNMGTRVYYVSFGGFDTHSNERNTHANLLGGMSDSIAAFLQDTERLGIRDRIVLMTFSEFGRRVGENASQGTDHGTAAPMFVVGSRVKGGLYGDQPSLTALDDNKNLKYGVDFRSVYGTALENWLGADQQATLGARYENVGFI
ncbi:MAG: hypothetical protein QOF51_4296 [Chloroflexota bacterium]|jgi:uncharacterized protein (DUF1501 family)|nr:hypothetical protein [Chloroflexota bacterium]